MSVALFLMSLGSFFVPKISGQQESIPVFYPIDCGTNHFYDFSKLNCRPCPKNTTNSPDHLSCICKIGFKKISDYGGVGMLCEQCPKGKVPSPDGWDCQTCGSKTPDPLTGACPKCESGKGEFLYFRRPFGTNEPKQECATCQGNTAPAFSGDHCVPCNPTIRGEGCECGGGGQSLGGVCFPTHISISNPDVPSLYNVPFKDSTIDSQYFRRHLRASFELCKKGNLTSCQTLGNLCVLLHLRRNGIAEPNACSKFKEIASAGGQENYWAINMPWLWYRDQDSENELSSLHALKTTFSFDPTHPNSKIRLVAAEFLLNGTFLGLKNVTGGSLQLCKNQQWILDAAFTFGRRYHQECEISVRDLWDKYELTFFDLWLQYEHEEESGTLQERTKFYPIPVRNLNDPANRNPERSRWKLTRRFFLVDNVAGKSESKGPNAIATLVRYASLIQLNIELKQTKDGHIYPPYLTVAYGEVNDQLYDDNPHVNVEFAVAYTMSTARHDKDIEITMGVLCSFGALWTGVKAMSWSRRAGKIMIDFPSVLKFLLLLAGTISDIFLIVMLGTSLWILVAFKEQMTVVYMILGSDQERTFLVYVGLAGALKLIEMIHLLMEQVTCETFFIDWERPRGHVIPLQGEANISRGRSAESEEPTSPDPRNVEDGPENPTGKRNHPESPITIWRTYLIANEWNELSSYRKTNYVLQLFFMVFMLEILNMKNLAIVEPGVSTLGFIPREFQDSRMSRFGLAAGLYLAFGLFQWFINVFIVERCIVNHFGSFVDLCSVSNISVFCLTRPQFGFYIHGRSVHGHADTDMREMNEMLQRERENLVSTRGLEPNSQDQCFLVALPYSFREEFENLLSPLRNPNLPGTRLSGHDLITAKTENTIQVYSKLNQFLTNFVDKQGGGNSYIVRDRTFLECLLDLEFGDTTNCGVFFRDPSETLFSNAFLYGHEWTQLSFDLLVFCILDLLAHDFLLAACISFLLITFLRKFREMGGTNRLVKTSLVDNRFLI